MKQTTFWCFLDRRYSFNGLKHLTEKVTAVTSQTLVRVLVGHTTAYAHPTAKISKVKDVAPIYWSVPLPHQDFICQKHLEQAFFCVIFLLTSITEMFIVNGKSHCCNNTYWRPVYIAASKECLKRILIIFILLAFH